MVSVGLALGLVDGEALGEPLGLMLGLSLGESDGDVEGLMDGLALGLAVGDEGASVGDVAAVGSTVGDAEGDIDGLALGDTDGHGMRRQGASSFSVPLQSFSLPRVRSFVPASHSREHVVHDDHEFQQSSVQPGSQVASVSRQAPPGVIADPTEPEQPLSRPRVRSPLPHAPAHGDHSVNGSCGWCGWCGWWWCGWCECGL